MKEQLLYRIQGIADESDKLWDFIEQEKLNREQSLELSKAVGFLEESKKIVIEVRNKIKE